MAENEPGNPVRTIIITRPARAAARTAARLRPLLHSGVRIIVSPLQEIVDTGAQVRFHPFDGAIFTSENGVHSILSRERPDGMHAFCVGERTAEAAERAGFVVVEAARDSAMLVNCIALSRSNGKLVYPRGRHAAANFSEQLGARGILVHEVVVYDQVRISLVKPAIHAIHTRKCVFPLYSARTARILSEEAADAADFEHSACCISNAVRHAFGLPWDCVVASSPDESHVLAETRKLALAG